MTLWEVVDFHFSNETDQKVKLSSSSLRSDDPVKYAQFGIPGQARNDTSFDSLTFLSASLQFKVLKYLKSGGIKKVRIESSPSYYSHSRLTGNKNKIAARCIVTKLSKARLNFQFLYIGKYFR